jgi:glycosyltransferase involved in cell wall biosynthesis
MHDLIFANSQKALIVGALAGLLTGRPVIWNLHDMLTADHFSRVNRRIAVTCANRLVDRVIVNSEATRNAFVESGGHLEKTRRVYNGIAAAPFDAVSDNDTAALRRSLHLREVPLIGVFSRLAPWKGQHVLIEALPALPEAHALFVGDALFEGDGDYVRQLHAQANRLGIQDRVHFLGFRDDIPTLMHTVDIVAHTSTAPEPFGRVVVEGMLAGRPVVATRAGGPCEIIDDDETGRLVPPGNADALAEVLCTFLTDSDTASRLATRGQEVARERFSVEAMLSAIEATIQATLIAAYR